MPKVNTPSRSNSFIKRQSSIIDVNDFTTPVNPSVNEQTETKVLIFNGKCSKVFKSVLEDCVEDCILEFPVDKNSIYVPKVGQAIPVPLGSKPNTILGLREQYINTRPSTRSNRRKGSVGPHSALPQINNTRSSMSPTVLATTAAARMRHQLAQQKFSVDENISEEVVEQESTVVQPSTIVKAIEPHFYAESSHLLRDETIVQINKPDAASLSLPAFPNCVPSAKTTRSYRERQKDYRLSDLVMLGPDYYRDVFNLPRRPSPSSRPKNKTAEKLSDIDRIKKDLFYRYLWTQKPQVSCRIRPLSTYARNATFVN